MRKTTWVLLILLCAVGGYLFSTQVTPTGLKNYIRTKLISYTVEDREKMSEKEFLAHIYKRAEDIDHITIGWIPYYHRHKKKDEIAGVIDQLLSNWKLNPKYQSYFFQLLNENPEQVEDVKKISENASDKNRRLIDKMTQETQWLPLF